MKQVKIPILSIIFIIFISSILIIDILLHKGIFTAHDIETNLIYFGAFYNSLSEGNIIPRWAGNIANLYGSPTIMFFYPLSYYLSSPIHFLGFSLIDSLKIYIFISFISSPVFMYLWLRKHIGDIASIVGAALYVYVPYRINDIYARGSVAENTFFMLLPLLLLALFQMFEKPGFKKMVILSIILSALILAHPFMLVVFAPIVLFYLIYLKLNFTKIKLILLACLFSLLSTSFYTVPLIVENKYTHYDISPFNGSGYADQFVDINKLVLPVWNFIDSTGKWEYQTYQVGLVQIGLFILSIIYILWMLKHKKLETEKNRFYLIGIIGFIISIFMMLPVSDFFYRNILFLQRIEFPWRYMSLNLFSLAVLVSALLDRIKINHQKWILIIILAAGIIFYLPYSRGHDYKIVSQEYYLYQIRENTDAYATLPRWAAQPDLYSRAADRYKLISGETELTILSRSSTKHIYMAKTVTDSYVADMIFYFPGWNVFIDGKPVNIEFQNPDYRGIITFNVPRGNHLLEVVFLPTKVRRIADIISLVTIILLLIIFRFGDRVQKISEDRI